MAWTSYTAQPHDLLPFVEQAFVQNKTMKYLAEIIEAAKVAQYIPELRNSGRFMQPSGSRLSSQGNFNLTRAVLNMDFIRIYTEMENLQLENGPLINATDAGAVNMLSTDDLNRVVGQMVRNIAQETEYEVWVGDKSLPYNGTNYTMTDGFFKKIYSAYVNPVASGVIPVYVPQVAITISNVVDQFDAVFTSIPIAAREAVGTYNYGIMCSQYAYDTLVAAYNKQVTGYSLYLSPIFDDKTQQIKGIKFKDAVVIPMATFGQNDIVATCTSLKEANQALRNLVIGTDLVTDFGKLRLVNHLETQNQPFFSVGGEMRLGCTIKRVEFVVF